MNFASLDIIDISFFFCLLFFFRCLNNTVYWRETGSAELNTQRFQQFDCECE